MGTKFIRVHGRVVPIHEQVGKLVKNSVKGAARDAALVQVVETGVNVIAHKIKLGEAAHIAFKSARLWGGISLAIRGIHGATKIQKGKRVGNS